MKRKKMGINPLTPAQQEEVVRLLYLAKACVRKVWGRRWYMAGFATIDDAEMAAMQKLCECVSRFKPARAKRTGYTIERYAARCILQYLKRAGLAEFLFRTPELGRASEKTKSRIEFFLRPKATLHADVPCRVNHSAREVAAIDNREIVDRFLSLVDQRSRSMIVAWCGIDGERFLSMEEIGERFGISKQRVGQIIAKAISRMRKATFASGALN